MAKKFIKRLMPDHQQIKGNRYLRIFGSVIHDANLWHLNRRSASSAFAIGLFYAFVPVPFQMLLAAGTAILFRANLPLSVGLVWLTNPITMPPIFYLCYRVGLLVLGQPAQEFNFQASWQWITDSLTTIGPAFLTGCAIMGTLASITGYWGINLIWRYSVAKAWKRRHQPPEN